MLRLRFANDYQIHANLYLWSAYWWNFQNVVRFAMSLRYEVFYYVWSSDAMNVP